jgi:HTH-type transcriptional regulator / antitoxin HigA
MDRHPRRIRQAIDLNRIAMIKLIKTAEDHAAAMQRIRELMDADPAEGTADANELEVLAHLAECYEQQAHDLGLPDPVEALKFRMEQQGLTRQDLVAYLGSPSRVSEVLARQRPINLAMARRLHQGLGIPAEVLLRGAGQTLPPPVEVDRFPFAEMLKRGWFAGFKGGLREARRQSEELLQMFFGRGFDLRGAPALCRQNIRSGSTQDPYALCAWKTWVLKQAEQQCVAQRFSPERLTDAAKRALVGLSPLSTGVQLVGEVLRQQGIRFVVESHLPGTHLDGAALRTTRGEPVIALTLRHDRLDNFWFTLLHELGHVALHLDEVDDAFFDDIESAGGDIEAQADDFAATALIPAEAWAAFRQKGDWSAASVRKAALEWNVHAAIVAGRLRRELRNYRMLTALVGHGEVRSRLQRA